MISIKQCSFCGQDFVPTSNRQKYCTREHWRTCPSCGKIYLEKFSENLSKPPRLCHPTCSVEHRLVETPEFHILEKIHDIVIIDSTTCRSKYDNLNISKKLYQEGLRCIHIFPEDDVDRIISKFDVSQNIDVSEFKVYKLNHDYVEEFLETNDIVPFYKSTSVALGLVRNYEIYQVMTFASPRYSKKHEYELIRCCTRLHTCIPGGLDLLSSEASINLGITSCIAYQDLSKQISPKPFLDIGMNLDHQNTPRFRPSGIYDCGTNVFTF